jgi:hypothetical protein
MVRSLPVVALALVLSTSLLAQSTKSDPPPVRPWAVMAAERLTLGEAQLTHLETLGLGLATLESAMDAAREAERRDERFDPSPHQRALQRGRERVRAAIDDALARAQTAVRDQDNTAFVNSVELARFCASLLPADAVLSQRIDAAENAGPALNSADRTRTLLDLGRGYSTTQMDLALHFLRRAGDDKAVASLQEGVATAGASQLEQLQTSATNGDTAAAASAAAVANYSAQLAGDAGNALRKQLAGFESGPSAARLDMHRQRQATYQALNAFVAKRRSGGLSRTDLRTADLAVRRLATICSRYAAADPGGPDAAEVQALENRIDGVRSAIRAFTEQPVPARANLDLLEAARRVDRTFHRLQESANYPEAFRFAEGPQGSIREVQAADLPLVVQRERLLAMLEGVDRNLENQKQVERFSRATTAELNRFRDALVARRDAAGPNSEAHGMIQVGIEATERLQADFDAWHAAHAADPRTAGRNSSTWRRLSSRTSDYGQPGRLPIFPRPPATPGPSFTDVNRPENGR